MLAPAQFSKSLTTAIDAFLADGNPDDPFDTAGRDVPLKPQTDAGYRDRLYRMASLMVLGARIADGCTTGHGISGVAQLAVGSMVAVAAMFVGAIATALMMKRV